MKYQFDLGADDYRDMNLAAFRWKPVVLHFLPHSLCAALLVYVGAPWALQASHRGASIAAAVTFVVVLSWLALAWHRKVQGFVNAHYGDPRRKVIFGAHTLELTESGLESAGPMHRTFRDWRSVTEARVTDSQMQFNTVFGVVYILPLRAVPDLPALEQWLRDKGVKQVKSSP